MLELHAVVHFVIVESVVGQSGSMSTRTTLPISNEEYKGAPDFGDKVGCEKYSTRVDKFVYGRQLTVVDRLQKRSPDGSRAFSTRLVLADRICPDHK
jgi:hypothetical protein